MGRKVEVVPYHAEWPDQFAEEARKLNGIFGDQLVSIHHFGSTAIPGISAKPVIDILIIARDLDAVDELTPQLIEIGYYAVGEYGIPGRRFFYKGTQELRTHHLHVYEAGNPHILRHIVFRDYLRTHPIPALEYARLKEELARDFPEDMESYIAGKNAFVKLYEKRALEWWAENEHEE